MLHHVLTKIFFFLFYVTWKKWDEKKTCKNSMPMILSSIIFNSRGITRSMKYIKKYFFLLLFCMFFVPLFFIVVHFFLSLKIEYLQYTKVFLFVQRRYWTAAEWNGIIKIEREINCVCAVFCVLLLMLLIACLLFFSACFLVSSMRNDVVYWININNVLNAFLIHKKKSLFLR